MCCCIALVQIQAADELPAEVEMAVGVVGAVVANR